MNTQEPAPPVVRRKPDAQYCVNLTPQQYIVLRDAALKRGTKCTALVQRLITTILHDELIDAVLDDRHAPP
jgi:hypothetical protein